ncbi:MAG: 1-deoxy-D-xylulose-5-phosphate synthase [Clostridia bacterium]|nr:1-deoxy-D-xylulose-5-phosphate synthase [Clostridia bacterium]
MLENIKSPGDVKRLTMKEKYALSDEIREALLEIVSETGGHLASNLGFVETTVALHSVFDAPKDKIIFDVGHQAYAHKMLTGRLAQMRTIRKKDGLSGFTRKNESEYDVNCSGHASDSISIALGMARANKLRNEEGHIVCVLGDGALTGGMCYEALNDAGHTNTPMIIVLNDNAMSISSNVGAMSRHLTNMRQSNVYRQFKQKVRRILEKIPRMGERVMRVISKIRNILKSLFINDLFFDALGIEYLGPVDGHDIRELERVFERAKKYDEPVLIHVVTKKGRGYALAEDEPEHFHGVQPFDTRSGEVKKVSGKSAGAIAVKKLIDLAEKDKRITAVSAAMLKGTGLDVFEKAYPDRTFDVGIAEEHAVTMAAGLALGGMKPYVAIYSTFLQRSYDQIMMDVCLNNAPVTFLIDRAGLNGADGETHQGIFDIAYLKTIPNLIIASPSDTSELEKMIELSAKVNQPMAIRYPRSLNSGAGSEDFAIGQWRLAAKGDDITLIASGRMFEIAFEVRKKLAGMNISAALVDARFVKPMDEKMLDEIANSDSPVLVLEDGIIEGGMGEEILRKLKTRRFTEKVELIGAEDAFIAHASVSEQTKDNHMDADSAVMRALKALGKEIK